ncbi:MAG: hypothetical protein KBS68_01190 [Clostridiales bacterium]|nr:hypothetical protein [Candidatus Crickella merdequi]
MNEDYPRRAFDPEIHTAQSICGMMHASKSEALIATQLTRYGISFRYEPKMILSNGRIKYPDFLIKHPKTGELIIWEHFGMMEKWDYVENNMNKLKDYAHEGFLINRNVIVTMESNDIHLSYEEVNRIIEQWFM